MYAATDSVEHCGTRMAPESPEREETSGPDKPREVHGATFGAARALELREMGVEVNAEGVEFHLRVAEHFSRPSAVALATGLLDRGGCLRQKLCADIGGRSLDRVRGFVGFAERAAADAFSQSAQKIDRRPLERIHDRPRAIDAGGGHKAVHLLLLKMRAFGRLRVCQRPVSPSSTENPGIAPGFTGLKPLS